jgi:hypothetical protein
MLDVKARMASLEADSVCQVRYSLGEQRRLADCDLTWKYEYGWG